MTDEKVKVGLNLNKSTYDRIRHAAIDRHAEIGDCIDEAMVEWLKKHEKARLST